MQKKSVSLPWLSRYSFTIATVVLVLMGAILLRLASTDSLTMDEKSHLPAGISYVTQHDYRLNPEHPPFFKLLSGYVADFARPAVPTTLPSWQQVNGQWDFGHDLLAANQTKVDRLIFLGRLPLVVVALLFGVFLFIWARHRWNDRAALIALTLYAFSPTILAHGHYVTFDVGAGLGFFLGLVAFIEFLQKPNWLRAVYAGLALGLVLLFKFSILLLLPYFALLILVSIWLNMPQRPAQYLLQLLTIALLVLATIYFTYLPLVRNYPVSRNLADAQSELAGYSRSSVRALDYMLLSHRSTQPLGHYLLGALLTKERAAHGNTGYFFSTVTNGGNPLYFPLLLITKETLPTLSLMLLTAVSSLMMLLFRWQRPGERDVSQLAMLAEKYFAELAIFGLIVIYWCLAVSSSLNIGIRHILPTLPLLYLLTGWGIDRWLVLNYPAPHRRLRYAVVGLLLLWLVIEIGAAYPRYLSYYNQMVCGYAGYDVAVDSNYDWGQDLKRLADYVGSNKINHLSIDYFGGADPAWYMGNKIDGWWSTRGAAHGWFAISMSQRQMAWGDHEKNVAIPYDQTYSWLRPYEPVKQIGSMLLYHLP